MPGMIPRTMSSRLGFVADVIATESPSPASPVVIQMTCAVTASVSCCLGTKSTGLIALLSADSRERVSHEHVHDPAAAEGGLDENETRRAGVHLADVGALLAAGNGGERGERRVGGVGCDERDQAALVRHVHRVD